MPGAYAICASPLCSALIWLPRGELPDIRGFDGTKVQPPPTPNPHPWWLLHEVITYALRLCRICMTRCRGLRLGIKFLMPKQITEFYITMGDMGAFGSNT